MLLITPKKETPPDGLKPACAGMARTDHLRLFAVKSFKTKPPAANATGGFVLKKCRRKMTPAFFQAFPEYIQDAESSQDEKSSI